MELELAAFEAALRDFEKIDLGYPKGEHIVRPQGNPSLVNDVCNEYGLPAQSSLRLFYSICDGIDLPDVENGFFVYSMAEFSSINKMPTEPNRFDGQDVVVVGSDGGGGRFVNTIQSDMIVYLPPGEVSAAREYLGENASPVADSMNSFLRFLSDHLSRYSE